MFWLHNNALWLPVEQPRSTIPRSLTWIRVVFRFFFFLLKGTSAEQDACRSEPGVPINRRGACKPLNWLLIRIKEWLKISICVPQFISHISFLIPRINNVVSDAWTPSISMVTVLNYRWLANPWECFYSLSAVIGRWAVCAAWQSAAFRVIVSLGSSAQGQDRIPEPPEAASSLFTRNRFWSGEQTKESIAERRHRAHFTASAGNLSLNREARHPREAADTAEKVTDGAEPIAGILHRSSLGYFRQLLRPSLDFFQGIFTHYCLDNTTNICMI